MIFWSVLGSVSYLYYSDRNECKRVKEEYLAKAKVYGQEPLTEGSLGEVRRVKVYAARWAEDDDTDRGLRYFRQYIKVGTSSCVDCFGVIVHGSDGVIDTQPYLVAAAIDYVQVPAPLYGSITRQVHADILSKRRKAIGLDATPLPMSLPGALDPAGAAQRELEGGSIIVGRATLKEYLEGLRRGWEGGVGKWKWEDEIEELMKGDGVFEAKAEPIMEDTTVPVSDATPSQQPSVTGLSFLSRPQPIPVPAAQSPDAPESIPAQYHIPPSPLPPQPPLLLVPWLNPLGFKQIPRMVYDFFTERYRVREGAELAWALINQETRPFVGTSASNVGLGLDSSLAKSDLEFDTSTENWYKSKFATLPERLQKARDDYYPELATRLQSVRDLASGARELTKEEAKSDKPLTTEDDLKKERLKKELRWKGMVEGWEIVRPEREVTWRDGWEGWLRVFKTPEGREGKA